MNMRRMQRGSSDLLFFGISVFDKIQQQEVAARSLVERIDNDRILHSSTAELAEVIYGQVAIAVPVLRDGPDDIETKPGEVKHQRQDSGRPYVAVENFIEVFVPFEGDGNAFTIRPSSYTLGGLHGHFDESELRFKISLTATPTEQVKGAVKAFLDETKKHLDTLRADFANSKARLVGIISQLIEARRLRLNERDQVAAGLGFKVRQ
jgi:hypothetical protein